MIFFRQVKGDSMKPTLRNGQIVFAHEVRRFKKGQLVIAFVKGQEVIKRISKIERDKIFLESENPNPKTGSKEYATVTDRKIEGVVFWPRKRLK